MEEQLETQRYKEGSRFVIYAPPLRGKDFGGRESKRIPPNAPYPEAPSWKTSVYYYWWEFLRRSEGYRRCCANGGGGKFSKLYEDFGDVFLEGDGEYGKEFHTFWNWWVGEHPVTGVNRGQTLFAEPKARRIVEKVSPTTLSDGDTLVLEIPLEHRTAYLINQFRTLLRDFDKRMQTARGKSRAKYPVYSKPVLTALHTALVVYDAMTERAKLPKKQQKTLAATFDDLSQKLPFFYVNDQVTFAYSERFDHEDAITDDVETDTFSLKQLESAAAKLGYVQSYDTAHNDSLPSALSDLRRVRAVVNRRKANALLRQWRIAEQYIANVEKGEFPKKLGR